MHRQAVHHLTILCVATAAGLGVPPAAAQARGAGTSTATGASERIVPLEVTVNAMRVGNWLLLERAGVLYAPREALIEWRLEQRPDAPTIQARGQTWYSLGSIPGFQAKVNPADQSVELVFSPAAFAASRIEEGAPAQVPLSPAENAAFVNFDTNLSMVKSAGATASRDLGLVTELGYTTGSGVFTSTFLGRDLLGSVPGSQATFKRLETTWTRNFQGENLTLRAGDSITRAGMWGRAVYFGGLQYGTNFSLVPGFISRPLPVIVGSSSAPSTVELYVNNALRQTAQVPAGPFSIQNLPTINGAGEARIVVRDVLGRETLIDQPFFSSAELLAKGLNDWNVQVGAVRSRLGEASANYGPAFVSGMERHGLTDSTTLEGRFELAGSLANAGAGVSTVLWSQVLAQAALAVSRDDAGQAGGQWLLGAIHDSTTHNASLRAQGATVDYTQLGQSVFGSTRRREYSASYSYNAGQAGSVGIGLARIQSFAGDSLGTVSLNYSRRIGERASLTLTATRVTGAVASSSVAATLTVPLDSRVTLGSRVAKRGDKLDAYLTADQGIGAETGTAWRVLGGMRDSEAYSEAGVRIQGDRLLATADVSASRQQQAARVGLQGGIVYTGGRVFASRRIEQSFALVEVPGFANVGVGVQGRNVTHTDEDGYALVTRLLPFQTNSIRLDPADLPISAELDTIEMNAVPGERGAVKLTFPVRSGRGALLRIVLDDGEVAPAGAEVRVAGDSKDFFVARRGESFVTGLKGVDTVTLAWKGRTCSFEVRLPPGGVDEIARVGPIQCHGVAR